MTDEDLRGCELSRYVRDLYIMVINEPSPKNAEEVAREHSDQDEFTLLMDPENKLKEMRHQISDHFAFFLFLHNLYRNVTDSDAGMRKVEELIQVSDANLQGSAAYASALAFEKGYGGGWLKHRFSFYKLHQELLAK